MIPTAARMSKVSIVFVVNYVFWISFCLMILFNTPVKADIFSFTQNSFERRKVDAGEGVWATAFFSEQGVQLVSRFVEVTPSVNKVRDNYSDDGGDTTSKSDVVSDTHFFTTLGEMYYCRFRVFCSLGLPHVCSSIS